MSRHIVIDRIVLDGFDLAPEHEDAFRARLTSELERRLSESWVDDLASRRAGNVETGPLEIGREARPADIATEVASRIVEGLKD